MIVEPATLLAFLPVALALNLTPGADMMFCLGQGLKAGPRAAMAANLGIATGGVIHVTAAGLGLAALLAALPALFEAIRWAGVGYLLWLAWGALRAPPGRAARHTGPPVAPLRAFREAVLVNVLNPKVALFVLALLPQFVDPAQPVLAQFLVLGAVVVAGGLVVNGLVGVFAGGIGRRLARSAGLERWLNRVTAAIFLALAARLALERR